MTVYARQSRLLRLAHRLHYATIRRWKMRASKWHPGFPHNEVVCPYEEWLAVQPRGYRKQLSRERHSR